MPKMLGKLLLLVEDEPMISFNLQLELEDEGARVLTASSCEEALAVLQTSIPDAAVLDFWLADRDCTDVASALHERGIPFILASGADPCDQLDSLAAATLAKPFTGASLVEALARIF
jgi:DNA-binding response OmpR family regulator